MPEIWRLCSWCRTNLSLISMILISRTLPYLTKNGGWVASQGKNIAVQSHCRISSFCGRVSATKCCGFSIFSQPLGINSTHEKFLTASYIISTKFSVPESSVKDVLSEFSCCITMKWKCVLFQHQNSKCCGFCICNIGSSFITFGILR